ncbi:16S rRNA (cytosine967-C5)-methyltransferase [Sphingomonas jinjuensis]|uniref:16S rRNA (Cytosine967-C5)-methyltransferase n=1 Tax=Sphingomonas jinjuensis TaxID=535907 RepID=A0A840FBR1_9SPHN|nr:RsmB/NOP family class I SAM-dependent RNA methyltransferase [Sphingomonas jinjuensis]MBB4154082.1 16S rRNA (cytosine967-C5)-methyltransferase [Sphingomonas jinjuensis]
MTPAALTQAAIELVDAIAAAAQAGGAAADTLIARYFATRRYAGSKDRRAVRDLVYRAIRAAGEPPASGRAAMLLVADGDPALAETFNGSVHGPARTAPDEPRAAPGAAPAWLVERLEDSGVSDDAMAALVGRATLDVRVNSLKARRATLTIPGAEPTPHAPAGLRLPSGTNVETLSEYRDGLIEVQDEGSQIVGAALAAAPGQRIIDLCAGAGGKTLQLAAEMAGAGEILACDIDRARLSRLPARAERAGATIVETRLLNPGREAEMLADWQASADGVLIDAPCSGTGTWRRNPEARWRLNADRLARYAAAQQHVLKVGAALVKPGGALAYIVCSLLDEEGADRIAAFLAANPGWQAEALSLGAGAPRGAGVRLDPASDRTDGFFVARLRAPC